VNTKIFTRIHQEMR